ncbi:hypothetical protein BC832DRAFT_535288, partial [Gaertneriomyces semiglobifer]
EPEFDFSKDEDQLKRHSKGLMSAKSEVGEVKLSSEQLKELKQVERERVQADRLRKMGYVPKEGMGVRYEQESP